MKELVRKHFFATNDNDSNDNVDEANGDNDNNNDNNDNDDDDDDEDDDASLVLLVQFFEPLRVALSGRVDHDTLLALVDAFAAFLAPCLATQPGGWRRAAADQTALLCLAVQYVDPTLVGHLRDCGVPLDTLLADAVRLRTRERARISFQRHRFDETRATFAFSLFSFFFVQFGSFFANLVGGEGDNDGGPALRVLLVDALLVAQDDALHLYAMLARLLAKRGALLALRPPATARSTTTTTSTTNAAAAVAASIVTAKDLIVVRNVNELSSILKRCLNFL